MPYPPRVEAVMELNNFVTYGGRSRVHPTRLCPILCPPPIPTECYRLLDMRAKSLESPHLLAFRSTSSHTV